MKQSSPVPVPAVALPRGFSVHVANIGIKDDTDDVCIIASDVPASGAGVMKSRLCPWPGTR